MASSICLSNGTAFTSKSLRIRFNNLTSHERVTSTKLPNYSLSLFPLKHSTICHSKLVPAHKSTSSTPAPFEEEKNYKDGDDHNYKNGALLMRYWKVGVSNLVMACVIGLLIGGNFGNGMLNPKAALAKIAGFSFRSVPELRLPAKTLITAKGALENLLDVNSEALQEYSKIKSLVTDEPNISMRYCFDLKSSAIKAGKIEDAEKLLREKYRTLKGKHPEPFFHVQMTLVELLILQSNYAEAKRFLENRLIESDARFPLYKAIIHTMLGDDNEAIKWWNIYTDLLNSQGSIPVNMPS